MSELPNGNELGQGREPGGKGATSPRGGGSTELDGNSGDPGEAAKDDTKPEPKPEPSPPENLDDTVAPGQPQSDLVLNKLRDILDKNEVTPDLEKDMGMSRTEMEQFVKRFEKKQAEAAGAGRNIEIKRGDPSAGAKPSKDLTGIDRKTSFSTRTTRDANTMTKDQDRGNVEGIRFQVPPELRGKFEGYVKQVTRSKGAATKAARPGTQTAPKSP
jgi:hypothetical protein